MGFGYKVQGFVYLGLSFEVLFEGFRSRSRWGLMVFDAASHVQYVGLINAYPYHCLKSVRGASEYGTIILALYGTVFKPVQFGLHCKIMEPRNHQSKKVSH